MRQKTGQKWRIGGAPIRRHNPVKGRSKNISWTPDCEAMLKYAADRMWVDKFKKPGNSLYIHVAMNLLFMFLNWQEETGKTAPDEFYEALFVQNFGTNGIVELKRKYAKDWNKENDETPNASNGS